MAISKIKPRHASEGRSIASVLKDRIDYDKNPDKTKGGLLVSSYQCDPDTAWQEFALSKQIYEAETGRKRAPENDVISYLIIQSFKPGKITPEDANKLGYQLALEFTGGQHQFLVATHVDKKHIHCHIEFNSTALDCSHKFNNYWNTYQAIRKINDRLSREHGLSVIEKPKEIVYFLRTGSLLQGNGLDFHFASSCGLMVTPSGSTVITAPSRRSASTWALRYLRKFFALLDAPTGTEFSTSAAIRSA